MGQEVCKPFPCAVEYGKHKEAKKREKANREQKKRDKQRLKELDRFGHLDKLQDLVNQYVVHVRDAGKPCFTCGNDNPNIKYDAGHYRSRGACQPLRFELTNIHKQCSMVCNQHGSGARAEYQAAIVAKYGQEHLDWLDGPHPLLKDQYPDANSIDDEIDRYRKLLREAGLKPRR